MEPSHSLCKLPAEKNWKGDVHRYVIRNPLKWCEEYEAIQLPLISVPRIGQTRTKIFQTQWHERICAVKSARVWAQFRVYRCCPLSASWVSKNKKGVQSVSRSVSQQRSDSWSDHRIKKRSIPSLDILITLALYKLAHLLSGTEFYSHDQIHFQMQPWFVKPHLSGAILSRKTENASHVLDAKTLAPGCT